MNKRLTFALCENRHEELKGIPALFPDGFFTRNDMFNTDRMRVQLHFVLQKYIEGHGDDITLELYVTGLTIASFAVVRFCALFRIPLIAYHWDKVNKTYIPQVVFGESEFTETTSKAWWLFADGEIDGLMANMSGQVSSDVYELQDAGMI